ncbi:MAG: Gfo/Idh/MocA family oxidoreductase [Kiritimatiellaeota bacterium]|nr:Gfo/Idh/MocA family oxidoreductase [Kiritimatiellota bacterium]
MKIKTAILGYGRSGSTLHADPIEKLSDFELTAVCDIDAKAKEKAYNRFKCRIYDDYLEMLRKETLDLVVIVTRNDQHCQMTCDCLKSGKNVLITKPWAINAGEARAMIKAAKASGKMLLPWLPARWGCDLLKLKELIASRVIGKVFQVRRSEFSFSIRHDWQTSKKFNGGYLLNWGPHLVDQPVQLVGQPVKSVYGELKQIINPGDVEDVFFAVMKTEDNVTIVSEYNIGSDKLPNWIIQGDRGTIYVKATEIEIHKAALPDSADPKTYGNQAKTDVIKDSIQGTNMITMQNRYGDSMVIYPHIARAIRGEEQYMVTLESALNLTKLLDAIRKAHETGRVICLAAK